jgi:hypothetical protein
MRICGAKGRPDAARVTGLSRGDDKAAEACQKEGLRPCASQRGITRAANP